MNYHKIDKSDMFQSIFDFPNQLGTALKIGKKIKLTKQYNNIKNIVIAGMGGSAVGGDLLLTLLKNHLSIPLYISRDYSLPNWVNKSSLVICSSYSGDTEETLSAFNEAKGKKSAIIGITTGGKLAHQLEQNGFDKIIIPGGLQPRSAVSFSLIPLIYLIQNLLNIDMKLEKNIQKVFITLLEKRKIYSIKDIENPVYLLSKEIYE